MGLGVGVDVGLRVFGLVWISSGRGGGTHSNKNNHTCGTSDDTSGHQQRVKGVSDALFRCIAFIEVPNELESHDDLGDPHTDEGGTRAEEGPSFFII